MLTHLSMSAHVKVVAERPYSSSSVHAREPKVNAKSRAMSQAVEPANDLKYLNGRKNYVQYSRSVVYHYNLWTLATTDIFSFQLGPSIHRFTRTITLISNDSPTPQTGGAYQDASNGGGIGNNNNDNNNNLDKDVNNTLELDQSIYTIYCQTTTRDFELNFLAPRAGEFSLSLSLSLSLALSLYRSLVHIYTYISIYLFSTRSK